MPTSMPISILLDIFYLMKKWILDATIKTNI